MKKHSKQSKSWIFWTPRILSILFILFLSLFSLDVFGNNYTLWQTALGLLIHNIPSLILLAVLIISWKYEFIGAIAFALAGLAYIILLITTKNFQLFMLSWIITIAGPAFAIAYLFYLSWKRR